MADAAAPSLGDFFKSKSKKKVKASNLNKDSTTTKPEDTKKKTKETEDDTWQEEQVVASTIKVEVAGKLMREDEKKDDEDTSAPAWGDLSKKQGNSSNQINEKRYPTLAKSVGSINIEPEDSRVNIKTSKNHFASLQDGSGSDEESTKRPKNIAPAMVSKKKGEFVKSAVAREVNAAKKDAKKKAKKADADSGDEEDEDEEEEEAEDAAPATEEEPKKKKVSEKKDPKKAEKPAQEEDAGDLAEDLKIQVDLVASKEKYKGRKKLPPVDLPAEEMEEKKETKQKEAMQNTGGKKKKVFVEEETDKKLAYAEW